MRGLRLKPMRGLVLASLVVLLGTALIPARAADSVEPLFASDEPLKISLPLDFRKLCRPREDPECDYAPTTLSWTDDRGRSGELPVELRIRGGWRSLEQNCSAPLLFVRFAEDSTEGTPFEGETVLPLTTHCGRGLSLAYSSTETQPYHFEQYLLREYLGYRLYRLFTDQSLRVRLVDISYPQPGKPSRVINSRAFFTEHFNSLARRENAVLLPRGKFDAETINLDSSHRLALFQYMIGNSDWSIARQRNLILLQSESGEQVPVPYDLDMSGLVNAHYAGPPPSLPIDSVTDRYYLGWCHPGTHWDGLVREFLGLRDAIMSEPDLVPGLDDKSERHVRRFMNSFFKTLDSESLLQQRIIDRCQPEWPPSREDHMKPSSR